MMQHRRKRFHISRKIVYLLPTICPACDCCPHATHAILCRPADGLVSFRSKSLKSVYAGPVMVGDGGSNRNRSGRVLGVRPISENGESAVVFFYSLGGLRSKMKVHTSKHTFYCSMCCSISLL